MLVCTRVDVPVYACVCQYVGVRVCESECVRVRAGVVCVRGCVRARARVLVRTVVCGRWRSGCERVGVRASLIKGQDGVGLVCKSW